MTEGGFERLLTSLSTRSAPADMARLASALDYALEEVCLAMNADSRTIRRLADEKLRFAWRTASAFAINLKPRTVTSAAK